MDLADERAELFEVRLHASVLLYERVLFQREAALLAEPVADRRLAQLRLVAVKVDAEGVTAFLSAHLDAEEYAAIQPRLAGMGWTTCRRLARATFEDLVRDADADDEVQRAERDVPEAHDF